MRLAVLSTLLIFPSPPTYLLFVFLSTFFYIHALLIALTNSRYQHRRPKALTNSRDQLCLHLSHQNQY